jgi:hypothetical protein
MHDKSVAELRAMVKTARKDKMKAPSKMKKHELLAELGEVVEKVEVPVVKVDGRVIGDGKPGPMTAKLLAAFRGVTRHDGELIFKE